jgi:hypothetical protein
MVRGAFLLQQLQQNGCRSVAVRRVTSRLVAPKDFVSVLLVFRSIVPYDQRPCLWNQFKRLCGKKKPRLSAHYALRAIAF